MSEGGLVQKAIWGHSIRVYFKCLIGLCYEIEYLFLWALTSSILLLLLVHNPSLFPGQHPFNYPQPFVEKKQEKEQGKVREEE